MNAIIGDNGIISNAQRAKIESEKADLWERIQTILVEAIGMEFEDLNDEVGWIGDKFHAQDLDATAGVYSLEDKTILITYGIKDGYNYSAIVNADMGLERELDLIIGTAYVPGDSENVGEWEIEVITSDNSTGQYSGSIGTARIIGYHGDYGEIVIPNTIYYTDTTGTTRGYFVTELGSNTFAFMNDEDGEKITSLQLNEGLKVIGDGCFRYDNLIAGKIEFPKSLKYIGDNGFYRCTQIEGSFDTILSQGIVLGKNVFYGCINMSGDISLLMPSANADGTYDREVMESFEQTDSETGEKFYGIPEAFLSGSSGLTGKLTIPSFIERIGNNAFYNCIGIEEIEYEANSQLKQIGDYAFYQCTGNKSDIDFSGITGPITIGEGSFYNATGGDINLTNVSEIGKQSFFGYKTNNDSPNYKSFTYDRIIVKKSGNSYSSGGTIYNVADLDLGNLITFIPQEAFRTAKLRKVFNSVDRTDVEYAKLRFGNQAFNQCTLTEFSFSVKNVLGSGQYVDLSNQSIFAGCAYLKTFEVPNEFIKIGYNVFRFLS
ncbi:MAG: leucine-rich repeat protein [Clostridia bacterium]|nr:leucine-rich repeat protein [Clostridia bacterium]